MPKPWLWTGGLATGLAVASSTLTANDRCAAPVCNAPVPMTCAPTEQAQIQSEQGVPLGAYVQPPAVGELEGESSGYGVRGLSIRFPELNLQLPSVQFPSLVKHRRGPQMHVAPATAPFVAGPAAQFGMLSAGGHAALQNFNAAPQGAQGAPQGAQGCGPQSNLIPPCPPAGAATERKLLEQLARKEAEIEELNRRFARLEELIGRVAEPPPPPRAIQPSSYEQPAEYDVPTRYAPANPRPASAPRTVPLKQRAVSREVEQPEEFAPTRSGVSRIRDEESAPTSSPRFGNWNRVSSQAPRNVPDLREIPH